jgi:hypothetical protein
LRRAGLKNQLFAQDSDFAGRGDAKSNAIAVNIENSDANVLTDDHGLSGMAGENEHVRLLLQSTR